MTTNVFPPTTPPTGERTGLRARFDRRRSAGDAYFQREAGAIARCAAEMADRFFAGGTLFVFGSGALATDAQHNAVEYVHPVLPGCRALPAISLANDAATLTGILEGPDPATVYAHQLRVLGRAGDIALALSARPVTAAVRAGLAAARERGMLTVSLLSGDREEAPAFAADHALEADAEDRSVAQELHLATYHILWELIHIVLNHRGIADSAAAPSGAAGQDAFSQLLYPMLSAQPSASTSVLAALAVAPVEKFGEATRLREALLDEYESEILVCARSLADALRRGGRVLACGNGGSATSTADLVAELMTPAGGRRPIPALSLTGDVAVVTAIANDVSFDDVFTRQLIALGRPGDAVVVVSTSGNSENLVRGVTEARRRSMLSVGLAGHDGGRMASVGQLDHCFVVRSSSVHRIQEVQTTLYHVLFELVHELMEEAA
ncbi:MAG: hypothetical protein NVSMB29_16640 [Candidatus Dormibacteria bacterium]